MRPGFDVIGRIAVSDDGLRTVIRQHPTLFIYAPDHNPKYNVVYIRTGYHLVRYFVKRWITTIVRSVPVRRRRWCVDGYAVMRREHLVRPTDVDPNKVLHRYTVEPELSSDVPTWEDLY